ELKLYRFGNLEVLEQRWVPGHEARSGESVATQASDVTRHRSLEHTVCGNRRVGLKAEVAAPTICPLVVGGTAKTRQRRVRPVIGLKVLVEIADAAWTMAERLPMGAGMIGHRAI